MIVPSSATAHTRWLMRSYTTRRPVPEFSGSGGALSPTDETDDNGKPQESFEPAGGGGDEELLVDLELLDRGAGGVVERARDRAGVIADAVQRLLQALHVGTARLHGDRLRLDLAVRGQSL